MKMREININIEGYNVNGICVGCLNYNRKMYYRDEIGDFYKLLCNIEVPSGILLQICWECQAYLENVMKFKQQILKSYDALLEYSRQQAFLGSPSDFSIHTTNRNSITKLDGISLNLRPKAFKDAGDVECCDGKNGVKSEPEDFEAGDCNVDNGLKAESEDRDTEDYIDTEIQPQYRKSIDASHYKKPSRISLRPRRNPPSYAPRNNSVDDYTANSSSLHDDLMETFKDDITNTSDNSPLIGINSFLNCKETYFLDEKPIIDTKTPQNTLPSNHSQVDISSNNITGENANIISDYQMYITASESDKSYLTENHTITSQALTQDHTTDQDTALFTNCVSDNSVSDFHDSSNCSSEFDDTDSDVTFNPASEDSSNDTSYTEETEDVLNETSTIQQLSLGRNHLEKPQDLTATYNEDLNTNDQGQKLKRIRAKDNCFFCKLDVLNFARHVMRHHAMEPEVQTILSYPTKSCTRKTLLTNLRKKGNYIKNVGKCVKPMKKSHMYSDNDYLPCEKCLGFYSRKQLWKHKKACQPSSETSNTQVQAQNFMLRNLNIDRKLRDEVFPKMRPDRVSLEAKQDTLICAFGSQYLRKIHRDKYFVNVASRKMRELAKLLLELKKLNPSLSDLMDCLKPQHYDLIVTATKTVASYDNKTDRYGAPTYAMNIRTSLKQCCNIAIKKTLKSAITEQTATIETDLKTLYLLMEANWKFDVSSQACNDLKLKKRHKITSVSLAKDLKILNNYLCEKSMSAASKLAASERSNIEAYNTLTETVYCRVLLLNRRRPGELQRLPLRSYQEGKSNNSLYEEFDGAISSAKQILVKSFKRIILRGKGGRVVPVLLTDEVQRYIDLLISVRRNYISDKNDFLFAKPGSQSTLYGYKVLEKYARASGARHPKTVTMTKLRKHLATLTQILNLKESDIEQLASFIGHTQAVHIENNRLPDDVYQMAKLSKLLLHMESGNADAYKGKCLEEINLDLEQDLLQIANEDHDNNDDDIIEYDAAMPNETDFDISVITPKANVTNTKIKKKRNLVPWTPKQKNIVKKFFSSHIKNKQPPRRHECEELRTQHPDILQNKDWLKIKVFIQNIYKSKK